MKRENCDVLIMGGGLAGLTLALQLRRRCPQLAIAVVERNRHPLPVAAHKVGESTVEIGAWYLAQDLGLEAHLQQTQLRKFGLRFFFGSDQGDIAQADELGASQLLPLDSYQLDRGLLENDLAQMATNDGVHFLHDTKITAVDIERRWADIRCPDGELRIHARWLIDASGRAALLKRKLALVEPNEHQASAVWWRVDRRIAIDDWSARADWQSRIVGQPRWLSTNHLMGPGYWVWLIPLASGATSIGIVADDTSHQLREIRNHEQAMHWLRTQQPQCAAALEGVQVLDFRRLHNYSHAARRVFSDQGWALTGEAGVFLDPFYSPGSDFIAISNTFITELIARESATKKIEQHARIYESIYFSFYQSTLLVYQDLYPGFGDRHLMVLKTTWDYTYYWAVLTLLFISKAMIQPQLLASIANVLTRAQKLNRDIQRHFRRRASQRQQQPAAGLFFDQCRMPWFTQLKEDLLHRFDATEFTRQLTQNVDHLQRLATALTALLQHERPADPCADLIGDLPRLLA